MEHIIQSLLDTDFYKFTMGQVVFKEFRNVPVRYAFHFRTKGINLADFIIERELRQELDHVMTLNFNNSDLHYLRGTNEYSERMFYEDYLDFLRILRLPDYSLKFENGLQLEFKGPWPSTIYWETYALSIISELYYRALLKKMSRFERDLVFAEGKIRLNKKIQILKGIPDITISDFATRRRFARRWQEYAITTLAEEMPSSQFLGTSNVKLAMDYGLLPMGTSAHEMYMGMSGIMHADNEDIRQSHNATMRLWYKHYGHGLSIALADNYGSDFFFRDMSQKQAEQWKGVRQDSGDPVAFGEKTIRFYERYNINPREKLIVFSDGLDVPTMVKLYNTFHNRIQITFGWGTNLSNDLGLAPISMVVKLVESNGHGTVKLSDNIAKAIGKPEDIERFKRIFSYDSTYETACTY